MKKIFTPIPVIFIFLLLIFGCNKDNFEQSQEELFFGNALTSVTNQQLLGKWTINQIDFEGNLSDVFPTINECGRDFFEILPNGKYQDFLFQNSDCIPITSNLTWTLSKGIITFSDGIETDQWVITELTSNKLVFKFRLDVDDDNELETFKAICNRYNPPTEMDVYSKTFQWDNSVGNNDKILLKWNNYKGYNNFEKYEIYRMNSGCGNSQDELISTITDLNIVSFIDENPPNKEELCYRLKIYTDKGLLGESDPITVYTSSLEIPNIKLTNADLNGTSINLQWEKYKGHYFSHYQVEVRNYSSGSGGGYIEEKIVEISDINSLNYTLEQPYFNNPVFVIHVYNTFGRKNTTVIEGENQISTNYTREGIFPVDFITFYAFSKDETVLYFTDNSKLYRYNYITKSVDNSVEINSSSIRFLEMFNSSFGKEVIINTGASIRVYDTDLNFKYNLITEVTNPEQMIVNDDGYWLITDREKLYSHTRANEKLSLLSTDNLYQETFCCSQINLVDIKQNRILVGNKIKSQGIITKINANGFITGSTFVDLNITSEFENKNLFSNNKQYLVDIESRILYSTSSSYNKITTLNQDFFPSGIALGGSLIFGSKNNPKPDTNTFQEKKVRILNYPSLSEEVYDSKGYPIAIYQNHLGQIISISKGLVGSLDYSSKEKDIFIEVIK